MIIGLVVLRAPGPGLGHVAGAKVAQVPDRLGCAVTAAAELADVIVDAAAEVTREVGDFQARQQRADPGLTPPSQSG